MQIITLGSDREVLLRRKARKVGRMTQDIRGLVDQMVGFVQGTEGVLGLAAPQVGYSYRILVAKADGRLVTLVDPVVISMSEETSVADESCLSLPGVLVPVKRALRISVLGRNRKGIGVTTHATGLLARVLQHELDHLDGILITDPARNGA